MMLLGIADFIFMLVQSLTKALAAAAGRSISSLPFLGTGHGINGPSGHAVAAAPGKPRGIPFWAGSARYSVWL